MKAAPFIVVTLSLAWQPRAWADESYTVDPVHSTVLFGVKHMGCGRLWGRFNKVSGQFTLNSQNPSASLFQVSIDPASIDTNNKNRDSHLRETDFFDAGEFKKIEFKSQSVKKLDDQALQADGVLDLHGVAKLITVRIELMGSASDPRRGRRTGIEATFTLKRSEFGMTFMPEMVGDDIRIIAALEGVSK